MDKTYTVFKDSTGLLPIEHKITYTIANPKHQHYKNVDVSLCFDPEKKKLKRLDFFVDEKLLFLNLFKSHGVSQVWLFQKKGSYQKITEEELSLILTISADILEKYQNLPNSFKEIFEVLPTQAKIYRKLFDKQVSGQEKKLLIKALREKNNLIENVQVRYKKLVAKQQSLEIGG